MSSDCACKQAVMFDPAAVSKEISELRPLAQKKFGLKTRHDAKLLKQLRRKLPKNLKKHVDRFTDANRLSATPKTAFLIDFDGLGQSRKALQDYLKSIDPAARRKDMWLDIGTSVGLNLVFAGVLVAALLAWRGFL